MSSEIVKLGMRRQLLRASWESEPARQASVEEMAGALTAEAARQGFEPVGDAEVKGTTKVEHEPGGDWESIIVDVGMLVRRVSSKGA